MRKILRETVSIAGGIMMMLLFLGAFANSYGTQYIKSHWVTNLAPIIFIGIFLVKWIKRDKEGEK